MSDMKNAIQAVSIEGTLGVGSFIVNDYLITIAADEDGNGYWMTVRKGSQEQTIHLTELKQEYVDEAIQTALAEAKASGEFDGYTPTANVIKSGGTATITIADAFGTTTADIEDGVSPVASVRRVEGGLEVEIVDAAGTRTGLIYDGQKGETGPQGVGISNAVLNPDFTLTLTFTDGTTWTSGSIRGPQGLQGVRGLQGPRGIQGLKGDTGAKGEKGDIGITPAFSIGTVTTLDPLEDATATISGTPGAPVLSLGIPKGIKGDTGEISEEEFEAVIAPGFDASTSYAAGSYVLKNGVLYKFTAAHSGAWTGTDAEVVTVGGEVTDLKADLNTKLDFALTGIRSIADRTSEFVPEYYIPNGAVGSTVDITAVTRWSTTSSKAAYCLFEVQQGDIIHAKGYSLAGSTNRFMVLLNTDKTVVWNSSAGAGERDITITATVDGYCLINAAHYSGGQYKKNTAIQLYDDTYKPIEQNASVWNQYKNKGYVYLEGDWEQGEFGHFASVTYAAKSPWMTLDYDTTFICTDPENYYLTFFINNNGTPRKNTSFPTWGVFYANTRIRVAVNAKNESETLLPDIAKTKLMINLPISNNEELKDTYSSVGVFEEIGIIGDSFAVGSMHWENDGYKGYPNLSWGKLMCKRNGNNCTLYAHGGYGIKRFVEYILPTVLADEPCNLYWWGLGINDNETARTNPTATGTIEDITAHETDGNYPDTIYGNFGRAVSQIKAHAPLAKHVFASCIKDNVNNRYTSYSAINTVLKIVAEHYGFPFIEITDDPFYWSAFYRDSAWTGHPVLIGYAGMSWANERLLNKCIVDNMTYFRDYGRTNNPDDTDSTDEL